VYAKRPFGNGPEQVLKYLARYTHRVAISNRRLIALEEGKVSFQWKDYAKGNQPTVMELEAVEFIRRLLQHVVPSGFVRIRHYGFLANRHRETKLQRCRDLLTVAPVAPGKAAPAEPKQPAPEPAAAMPERQRCPSCGQGRMAWVEDIPRPHAVPEANAGEQARATARTWDSS
jgi:Putative transposase